MGWGMANESCGTLLCPMCETPGEVRRYKNHARGKMYIACECGQIRPALNQSYILRNGEFIAGHPLAPDAGEVAAAKAAHAAKKGAKTDTPSEGSESGRGSVNSGEGDGKPAAAAPEEPVTEKPPVTEPAEVAKPVNEKSPPKKPVKVKVRAQAQPQSKPTAPDSEPVKKWGGFF